MVVMVMVEPKEEIVVDVEAHTQMRLSLKCMDNCWCCMVEFDSNKINSTIEYEPGFDYFGCC